jgi:hypothetical protein
MLRVIYLEVYMFKTVSRMLLITVMLVAFVGQATVFNAAMSCETSVDSLSPTFSELGKHYDSNTIETGSSEDCCGIECCDMACTCIANACSSFAYVNTEVDSIKPEVLSEAVYRQTSKQPKSIATLLYRPPIFSS